MVNVPVVPVVPPRERHEYFIGNAPSPPPTPVCTSPPPPLVYGGPAKGKRLTRPEAQDRRRHICNQLDDVTLLLYVCDPFHVVHTLFLLSAFSTAPALSLGIDIREERAARYPRWLRRGRGGDRRLETGHRWWRMVNPSC